LKNAESSLERRSNCRVGLKVVVPCKKTKAARVVLDEKSQEQPADKERAQKASKTKPGHMPEQRIEKDKLQPLREKSGF
jgi:hypothetical protein